MAQTLDRSSNLCSIFRAFSWLMSIPSSARDCWISKASMRPVNIQIWFKPSRGERGFLFDISYHHCSCPSSWKSAVASSRDPSDTWRTRWSPDIHPCFGLQRTRFSARVRRIESEGLFDSVGDGHSLSHTITLLKTFQHAECPSPVRSQQDLHDNRGSAM